MRYVPALLLILSSPLTVSSSPVAAPAHNVGLAAAQRLPANVKPEHYRLWLTPDLKTDTFAGQATIRVRLASNTSEIQLHAAEITFEKVRITAGGQTQEATVALHPETETASLTVAQTLPAGPAEIDITYKGILNDKLRGFYLSKANGRKYAVSQMEPTDARRAFPSFDEPALKATFDISLTIDDGDIAISNGAQISDTPGPGAGKHTVAFATTKPMSTYLVALLVGDFTCRETKAGATPLRVCATPDKKALTGFALEAAVQQLAFYNDYFEIPYPFDKLDIIGIPDFSAGAMENVGAITFREQYLLADPERASLSTRKTIAAVMSHEIAHQWFGDLVTMQWWDDLWLNEGFATWMANKPLAVWRPEWNVELDEAVETQRAIATDALQSTRPIRTRVETPEEINEVFDAIAYQKSAAVLRMVEGFADKNGFRKGVSAYLKKFSYSNATAEDFWTEVARVSGKPVDRIMASYVDQPGVPLLEVASRCAAEATEVAIQQRRFAGAPKAVPPPQTWVIPVCLKTGTADGPPCEVISKQDSLKVPGCTKDVFVNRGSVGYFVTEYVADSVRELSVKAETMLTPAERLGFLGDEWWMVRSGRHDIGLFLDLAGELADDTTPAIVDSVTSRVAFTAEELTAAATRPRLAQWIQQKFGPVLKELGVPSRDTDEQKQSRWAALAQLIGIAGEDRQFQNQARDLAARLIKEPGSLPLTIAPAVLRVAAYTGDAALYNQYLDRLRTLSGQPEDYYLYFDSLPYFRDPALVDRTLAFAMSAEVRSQDTGSLIAGVLSHPWGRDAGWKFVTREWPALTKRLGVFQGLPTIVVGIGTFCSADAAAEVKQFFTAHPLPSAERTVRQAIERVENCAAMKARQTPALDAWLNASREK